MNTQTRGKLDILFAQALFLLWTTQSFVTFVILAKLPSDIEQRVFGLYSAPRLAELIAVDFTTTAFITLNIISFRFSSKFDKIIHFVSTNGWKEILFFAGITISIICQASLVILRALAQNPNSYYYAGIANHLAPIMTFISLLGLELAIWEIFLNRNSLSLTIRKQGKSIKLFLIIWGMLGIFSILIVFFQDNLKTSRLGVHFGGPAVPLLEWQIIVAWILSTLVMLYGLRWKTSLRHPDIWVAGCIWAITSILWISQPVNPGYAATVPSAPNYEIYPFSDAQLYAQNAQSIVIGKGMAGEQFPARPLYIVFLALAHALVGQNYTHVIALQTLILAIFPAVLYLLGREISGRPLGIAIAFLAILRDITANNVAPFTVSVTYSKLFISELPVALLLSLFTLLCIRWLKNNQTTKTLPFLTGGLLGLATLIRTQSIVAILPLFLIALTIRNNSWKKRLIQLTLVVLGTMVSLSPWLWRNWQITGGIVIDNPLSQMNVFATRYAGFEEGAIIPHLPNENDGQYSSRMLDIAIESVYNNPKQITNSVISHFFRNETGNLLVFPVRNSLPGMQDLFMPTTNFWEDWDTPSALAKPFLLLLYISLFGIGVAVAWKKTRWLGLLPLGVNLSYNAWTAIFLSSGTRFIFPVDWVFYTYEMLGLLSITIFLFSALGTSLKPSLAAPNFTNAPVPTWIYSLVILLVFLAGISLPLSEHLVPDQYPDKTQAQMWAEFSENSAILATSGITPTRIRELADTKELSILEGRATYPRYFQAGEGIPQTAKPGYEPSDQARLVFYLVGQETGRVIFPLEKNPDFFPNAADVTMIIQDNSISNTWLILVSKDGREEVYTGIVFQEFIE